jgi:hypothetical protein
MIVYLKIFFWHFNGKYYIYGLKTKKTSHQLG